MPQMLGPTEVVGGGGGADPGLFDATCAAGVALGEFVRLTGNAGPEVEAADAYVQAKIPSVGVVVAKPTATTCQVRTVGPAAVFAGLIAGKVYWLNASGGVAAAPPSAPLGTIRWAQTVGYALDGTTMMVDINPVVRAFDRV